MARYIVDFETTCYITKVVSADSQDEADRIVDRLFDSEEFLNTLQWDMIDKMHDPECFGENTDARIYREDTDNTYGSEMAINEYLEG